MMRGQFLLVSLLYFLASSYAQKTEIIDMQGNHYVGKIVVETDETVCIENRDHKLCFDSSEIEEYGKYKAYARAYPLTKDLNPVILYHDIGGVYRSNVAGTGGFYSFSAQKRINNHLSTGLEGGLGIGDFLEFNLRGIASFQLSPHGSKIHSFSIATGPLQELVYWSEDGFDINLGYALLLRKERNRSRRLAFSAGFYSAKYNWCSGDGCTTFVHRSNELQVKLAYGWQF
jgi:hypothetical protein